MKKTVFLALMAFVSLNMSASGIFGDGDIWGNETAQEDNSGDVFGESSTFDDSEWLSAHSGDTGNWGTNELTGENPKGNPNVVPVGEGLLILFAGGAAYAASKLRRKK